MRYLSTLLLVLICCPAAHAEAPANESFSFRNLGACSEEGINPFASDRLLVKRKGTKLVVSGHVVLNCAVMPAKPSVQYASQWVSISFEEQSPSGAYTSCVCSNKVEFVLLNKVASGSSIYLVRGKSVSARTTAP
jgi:hypothetical protein